METFGDTEEKPLRYAFERASVEFVLAGLKEDVIQQDHAANYSQEKGSG